MGLISELQQRKFEQKIYRNDLIENCNYLIKSIRYQNIVLNSYLSYIFKHNKFEKDFDNICNIVSERLKEVSDDLDCLCKNVKEIKKNKWKYLKDSNTGEDTKYILKFCKIIPSWVIDWYETLCNAPQEDERIIYFQNLLQATYYECTDTFNPDLKPIEQVEIY